MTNPHRNYIAHKHCHKRLHELRQDIGAKIHELRRSRRLTLQKLSALSGLNALSLDYLERGRGELNLYHIIALAHAFRLPETYFLNPAQDDGAVGGGTSVRKNPNNGSNGKP